MSIRGRLLSAFALIALIAFFSAALIFQSGRRVERQRAYSSALQDELVAITYLRANVRNQIVEASEVILLDTPSDSIAEAKQKINESFVNLSGFYKVRPELKETADKLQKIYERMSPELDLSIAAFKAGRPGEGRRFLGDATEKLFRGEFLPAIKGQIDRTQEEYGASTKKLEDSAATAKRNMIFSGSVLFLFLSIIGFRLYRSISLRLIHLVRATEVVAQGNFDGAVEIGGTDEIAELAHAFKLMIERLRERTGEAKEFEKMAVESAHSAGMSEIATGALHNVGNVLNSANVGTELIIRRMERSAVGNLFMANDLLREHKDRFDRFYQSDPKGKKLLDYYLEVGDALKKEFGEQKAELSELMKRIQLIKDIINTQQAYAKGRSEFREKVSLTELVESALVTQATSLLRHEIKIVKSLVAVPAVLAQRTKLMHVVINLIKNAKEAMVAHRTGDRVLTLEVSQSDETIFLRVTDTGVGIEKDNLQKIFNHGFTTKQSGHGFGLHFSANATAEMGGRIAVVSEGLGKGSQFTISFNKSTDASGEIHNNTSRSAA